MNHVFLRGRIGKVQPEEYTPMGLPVRKFSMAVNEKYKDKINTQWFTIVCFGQLASWYRDELQIGSMVSVNGKMVTRSWEDQSGQKKSKTEIVAREITIEHKREITNDKTHTQAETGEAQGDYNAEW